MWCEWGDAVERMGLVLCCIQKGRRESLILLAEFLSKFLLYGLFCERAAALVSRQPFGLHPRQHLLDASHLDLDDMDFLTDPSVMTPILVVTFHFLSAAGLWFYRRRRRRRAPGSEPGNLQHYHVSVHFVSVPAYAVIDLFPVRPSVSSVCFLFWLHPLLCCDSLSLVCVLILINAFCVCLSFHKLLTWFVQQEC